MFVRNMIGLRAVRLSFVNCHGAPTLSGYPVGVLDFYTLLGYPSIMVKESKAACLKRLSRIEGQVRGLSRMVEEDRYCIDIVTQIAAVRAALRRVEEAVLHDHIGHCVEHAIESGSKSDQRQKITELIEVLSRTTR
jgi:CsoR family transcriptional regulator, copper-sensing transcriptional repressor